MKKLLFILLMSISALTNAQNTVIQPVSAPWTTAYTFSQTTVNGGYKDWGNGVVQMTDSSTGNGCQGTTLLVTGTPYNTNSTSTFSICYNAYFGCPGNDAIGSDQKADGMSFSFIRSSDVSNLNFKDFFSCGGGLGYANAFSFSNSTPMLSIEFDTWSSQGSGNVDIYYGGSGVGSINDEIAIHLNGDIFDDAKMLTSLNVGNLEDGKVHLICITYTPVSPYNISVTIDGVSKLSYDLNSNNLSSLFGSNQNLYWMWGAGKNGSVNFQAVSPQNVNIFGTIGHAPPCNLSLPITLIDFNAELVNNSVLLTWSTYSEKNNKEFVIEKSYDGQNWENIDTVKGAGNSSVVLGYDYIDNTVKNTNYYRLVQIDIDNAHTYSKIISVDLNNSCNIIVAPNPFDESLNIKSTCKEEIFISIYDVRGNIVYTTKNNGEFTIKPELNSGSYVIVLKSNTFISRQKIIKK